MTTPAARAHSIELAPQGVCNHVAIDIPPAPLAGALKQTLDGMWMRPATRQRAEEALLRLGGFGSLGAALLSTDGLEALVSLHQLGVVNLRDCRPFTFGRDMNAIDLLVDFAPNHESCTEWGVTPQPPETLLKTLVEAGISLRGHAHSPQPPLARALTRADAVKWVEALLNLGADPLQRSDHPHVTAQPRPKPTCLALAAQAGPHEAESRMAGKLLSGLGESPKEHKVLELFEHAIKSDSRALFSGLMAHPGIEAEKTLGTALQRWGREIGLSLARHFITATATRNLTAELFEHLDSAILKSHAAHLANAMPSPNGCEHTKYALSRLAETGDTARLGGLRDTLLALPRNVVSAWREQIADTDIEATIRELITRIKATGNNINIPEQQNRLKEFETVWANHPVPALGNWAAAAGDAADPALAGRGDALRRDFHDLLKNLFGPGYEEVTRARKLDPPIDGQAAESADDALIRAMKTGLAAVEELPIASNRLEALLNPQIQLNRNLHNCLKQTASRTAGEMFNGMLDHAAERQCAKSMLALLPLSAGSGEHHLQIANPRALLKKVAGFRQEDRVRVVRRVCQQLSTDVKATLRTEIDQYLPLPHLMSNRRLLLMNLAGAGIGSAAAFLASYSSNGFESVTNSFIGALNIAAGAGFMALVGSDDYLHARQILKYKSMEAYRAQLLSELTPPPQQPADGPAP